MQEILNDSGKLLFVITVLFLLFESTVAIFFYSRTRRFLEGAQKTMARVTSCAKAVNNQYSAEVTFMDSSGHPQTQSLTSPTELAVGRELEVLFDPNMPSNFKINSFVSLWMFPIVFAGGVAVCTVALTILTVMGIAKFPF